MKTLKTRLAKWVRLVRGTCEAVVNPRLCVLERVGHLVLGVVIAPVALVVILARG
jgi:hypothetical protein